MELNGTDVSELNLFNIDVSNLPDELGETLVSKVDLKQSNIIAEIPFRFAETTLKDIDQTLASKVKDFALSSNNDKVFLLFGSVGMGKTSAMCAAIHERQCNGLDCGLYFSIRFLMPKLRTTRSFSAKENEESFYRRLSTVPFLCLDEIGTCPNRDEEREFLTTILSARYDNCLPTFIATNLSPYKFKYLITGVDGSDKSAEEQKVLCDHLDKTNAMLNRIKSVAIPYTVSGESYRTRG